LEYFDTCLRQIKEALDIQKNAFFLFKLPYLYCPLDKYEDNENENMKKINWKQKYKIKSYLLHAKIKYSLIINGKNIDYCTSEGKASELFWYLIENSRSIICCRCSPSEKSKIVEFVKNHTKDITLAIGDGENDVNMIKAANLGIGIFGKEGCQAAFNSDYAFHQFKYLKRLLFYNGRFTLLRNTYFLNMFFFKNFFYTMEPIIFTFFSLYSGTFLYDEFYDSMFNTILSILPLILFSILDEDVDLDFQGYEEKKKKWMLYLLPSMYKQTRDSRPFNIVKYLICTFISVIYALFVFLFLSFSYIHMIKNIRGETITYFELIFYVYFSIIFIHFFMVYIDTSLINWLIVIFFFAQIFADIIFVVTFNRISNDNKLSGIIGEIFHFDISFLSAVMTCSLCCLPFYILRRAELYFGINYSNLIKINRLKAIYFGNYYKKEIQRMITATRAIAKFKRIYKDFKSDKKPLQKYENLNDLKMIKVIERWERDKQRKKNNN
jgi:magnesium-transporting ATPase (P-type)